MRSGSDAPGESESWIHDAGGGERGAACGRVELAALRHLQRAVGQWLTITTGTDRALNGQRFQEQRVDQISDDVYGEKTLNNYFNRAAFAQPALGTFGNMERNSVTGPAFWTIDLALSKLIAFGTAQNLELRVEAFNLLNHFNWGNPGTNLNAPATFGRVQSLAGTPPNAVVERRVFCSSA